MHTAGNYPGARRIICATRHDTSVSELFFRRRCRSAALRLLPLTRQLPLERTDPRARLLRCCRGVHDSEAALPPKLCEDWRCERVLSRFAAASQRRQQRAREV